MKMLIASDLHGSAACIRKLIKRIDEEKPDRVILLGDILYHGPRNALPEEYDTMEAVKLINQKAELITAVRGNCDSEIDTMLVDFLLEAPHMILSDNGLNMFVTHGHHYNLDHLPPMASINILLHGHTHIPAFEKISEGKYYINPGSVSIPKGGSDNSYLMYENRKFVWKNIDGNAYREETV